MRAARAEEGRAAIAPVARLVERAAPAATPALALACALALAAGCAGWLAPVGAPATAEERRAYEAALEVAREDPRAGEARLEAFLGAWPGGALADDAGLRLAELANARGDEAAALDHLYAALRAQPAGDRTDELRLAIARLELAAGDDRAAAREIGRVRLSRLDPEPRREALDLLARAARDPVARVRWLSRLRAELVEADEAEVDPEEIAALDARIDDAISTLALRDLRRAAAQLGDEVPAARTWVRAAELALDGGDAAEAGELLERAAERPLAPAYVARLREVEERVRLALSGGRAAADLPTFAEALAAGTPSVEQAVGTLGVVLPLSGPFARFGEESLEGVLLAAGIFPPAAEGPRVRVLIRDSGGQPERAAEAVRDLVFDRELVAIVGPLLSGECEAAASEAERAGVPLLALSSREEIAQGRGFVFRVRTQPREEVQVLVDHAMETLGAQTFAILYPRDAYGRGLRRLFWDTVEQRGGAIVGVASYDPEATDFAEPIRSLVGYDLLTPQEKERIKERERMRKRARRLPLEEAIALREEARDLTGPDGGPLPPIVDFDALFVPESHEKVSLIAPQLAFHEALETRLLGPNGWHHEELLEIAERHVEGAVVTSHFFAQSEHPPVRRFGEGYAEAFESPPDLFAAQAYDATRLVLAQLARGHDEPESLRDGLLRVRAWPGVTGVLSMRSDGNAAKRPFLLTVERGRFVELP